LFTFLVSHLIQGSGLISRLHITPKQDESYHLWYIVGGGGGHTLNLDDVKVQSLLFDDPSHSFAKAHNFLVKSETFQPWDKQQSSEGFHNHYLLFTICESVEKILTQGESVSPPMISFFRRCGVLETDLSVNLMDSIRSIWDNDQAVPRDYVDDDYDDYDESSNEYESTEYDSQSEIEDNDDGGSSIGFQFDHMLFSELPDDARGAAETLGYCSTTWDLDTKITVDSKLWSELAPEQQRAAIILGYSEEMWNEESDSSDSDSDNSDSDHDEASLGFRSDPPLGPPGFRPGC